MGQILSNFQKPANHYEMQFRVERDLTIRDIGSSSTKLIDNRRDTCLLLIETQLRFERGHHDRTSLDFENLRRKVDRELSAAPIYDKERIDFSMYCVQNVENHHVRILMKINPPKYTSDIWQYIREQVRKRYFVYDDSILNPSKSGTGIDLTIMTKYRHEEGNSCNISKYRAEYLEEMKELLGQDMTVKIHVNNITEKNGYDFVPFTIESDNIDIQTVDGRLRKKLKPSIFEEISLLSKEQASWFLLNPNFNMKHELQKRENIDIFDLKIQRPE